MMTPDIDIVFPVRDAEATLTRAIESVLRQTYPHFRLLLINDGSRDGTVDLMCAYRDRDSRVICIDNNGQGLVDALNGGLGSGTAPLIARMDADDEMMPERLAKQYAFMQSHSHIGVVGSCAVVTDGLAAGFRHYVEWSNALLAPDQIARSRFIESPLIHPTVMYRRTIVNQHGGYFGGDFPEDYELWLRWLDAGISFAKLPEPLHVWTDHAGRLTRIDPRYRVQAFFDIKAKYLSRWLQQHSPHGNRVWVWGAGAPTRKRVRSLIKHGIEIQGFVDIDPRKIGTRNPDGPVIAPEDLPGPAHSFVLSAVGSRGARQLILRRLKELGYQEELSCLAIA